MTEIEGEGYFSWQDAEEVFAALRGQGGRIIVVGGQAVNFWVQWCEKTTGASFGELPFASKDIDLVGNKGHVEQFAKLLHGKAFVPPMDSVTPEQGYVEAVVASGRTVRIDFLIDSRPNDAKTVKANAVPFKFDWGELSVMDPVSCMRSRAYNVIELAHKYNTPHARRQLMASIQVIPEFCKAMLANENAVGAERLVLDIFKSVFKFSTGRVAKRLWKKHQIDTFQAVQLLPGLPEKFETQSYLRWLDTVRQGRQ